jgi:hypothetical protein
MIASAFISDIGDDVKDINLLSLYNHIGTPYSEEKKTFVNLSYKLKISLEEKVVICY